MLGGMTAARWSWLGDRLALDAANTVRRRGWRYIELITSPADLRGWLARERGRLAIPAEVDAVLVARFILTRDHVLRVLRAAAGGAALPQPTSMPSTSWPPRPRPSGCSEPGLASTSPARSPGPTRPPASVPTSRPPLSTF